MTQAAAVPGSLASRLIRGGGWSLLGRALALPIGLLQAMLLARLIAPGDLGAYFLTMSLVVLLSFVAQGGLGRAMVKVVASAIATDRPRAARYGLRVAWIVTLLGGLTVAILLTAGPGRQLVGLLHDGALLIPVLPMIGLLVIAFAFIDLSTETLRGFHDLRAASVLTDMLLQRLLLVLVLTGAWLMAWPLSLITVLAVSGGAALATLAAAALLLRPHLAGLGSQGTPWRTTEILRHGPPFLLVRVNTWLMAGADLWILAMFRPPEEVALYGAASRLALLAGIPFTVCNGVIAPVIAELFAQGRRAQLERVVRAGTTLSALPSVALVCVFALFGEGLLRFIFTDAYGDGYVILVILAFGQLLHVAAGPAGIALNMTGFQADAVIAAVVTAVVATVGYLLVAPHFGAPGVAVVTTLSLFFNRTLTTSFVRRRLGITTWITWPSGALRRLAEEISRLREPRA